ncbi:hypothetical protein V2J09_022558 [Rumex salicifolius]
MEQPTRQNHELVIDIPNNEGALRSVNIFTSNETDIPLNEDRSSSSLRSNPSAPTSNNTNSRVSSFGRPANDHSRRRSSPLNSGIWIFFELFLTLCQIMAAVVVLYVSRHEHPHAPLFVWVAGYAVGCVAFLPLIYQRYVLCTQASEQSSTASRQNSPSVINGLSFPLSVPQRTASDDNGLSLSGRRVGQNNGTLNNARIKALFEYLKMALDCFFAIWFVVGNVWIFGGRTSSSDAPNLYRLCIVFLTISCIGYAMPFILCATICCCLPCIISVMGFREDLNHIRGATNESINALSTYKYKLKKNRNNSGTDGSETGVVGAGTEKERVISGEDAVCCICLADYANNDELKELPCSHLFHKDCVDKWLQINALCPLCKTEVGAF